MRVVTIPCLKDNYAYLVVCEATNRAAIIDPSESDPVIAAVEREGVELVAIWITHHHWDHTGGNKELVAHFQGIDVVGFVEDEARVPGITRRVSEGDEVILGDEVRCRVIHNPGHTTGAISFYDAGNAMVFTGDTLFAAGCGRMFEGTPPMFYESLRKLAALPPDTDVYCGHEYTASNLRFAAAVEPDNAVVAQWAKEVAAPGGTPSVPYKLARDLDANPFLRADHGHVAAAAARQADDAPNGGAAVFAALRRWKDSF